MYPVFGEIRFKSADSVVRRYAVVDDGSEGIHQTLRIMTEEWELESPKLIISVHGIKRSFDLEENVKQHFGKGLMKAVRNTGLYVRSTAKAIYGREKLRKKEKPGAWIVTEGIDTGVSGLVGDAISNLSSTAISKHPIVAIGISKFDRVHQGNAPLHVTSSMPRYQLSYTNEDRGSSGEYFLDPHHTHFILVHSDEDQYVNTYRYPLMRRLIGRAKYDKEQPESLLPFVYVIACGDMTTLAEVEFAVEHDIPVLLIYGSGNIADIMSVAVLQFRPDTERCGIFPLQTEAFPDIRAIQRLVWILDKQELSIFFDIEDNVLQQIMPCLSRLLDSDDEDKAKTSFMAMKDLIRKKFHLFTVCNLDGRKVDDMEEDLLLALVKAHPSPEDQLLCAVLFNSADFVRNRTFEYETGYMRSGLPSITHRALLENKDGFLEALLDRGMNARNFLTQGRLLYLYVACQNTLFTKLLKKVKKESSPLFVKHIGYLMQLLMGDFYPPGYLERYGGFDEDFSLPADDFENIPLDTLFTTYPLDEPFKHLLLWSILVSRKELSILFWKHGKDKVAAALVAYGLFRSMSHATSDFVEKRNLMSHAITFNDLALAVLSESSNDSEQNALRLLSSKVRNWGNKSCIELAVGTGNKHFISHKTCQSLLKTIWMGKMDIQNSTTTILTCVVIPPAALLLIKFGRQKADAVDHSEQNEEELSDIVRGGYLSETPEELKETTRRKQTRPNQGTDVTVKQGDAIPFYKKLYHFYTSPVVIFVYNILFYILFLTLYSYVLLIELSKKVSNLDIVLFVWVFSICLEEIRQVTTADSKSIINRLRRYIKDLWNVIDVITILLFICGTVLRFLPFKHTLDAARIVLGMNLVTFFLRILHVFSVHRKMGPKIVMIGRMFHDLMYFLVILMVFVVGYAIAAFSVLYPNSTLSGDLIMNIFKTAYWNLFGELFLEDLENKAPSCTTNPLLYSNNTLPRCPAELSVYIGPILTGIYVLFSNILLLNLLIAMFSFTFEKIHDNTDLHWHYQRSTLIMEYNTRPPLPPPFIMINHVILVFRWIIQKCKARRLRNTPYSSRADTKKITYDQKLRKWENTIAHAYLQRVEAEEKESVNNRVTTIHERIEELSNQIDSLFSSLSDGPDRAVPSADGGQAGNGASGNLSPTKPRDNRSSLSRSLISSVAVPSKERFVLKPKEDYVYDPITGGYLLQDVSTSHATKEQTNERGRRGSLDDYPMSESTLPRDSRFPRSTDNAIVTRPTVIQPPTSRHIQPIGRSRSFNDLYMEDTDIQRTYPSYPPSFTLPPGRPAQSPLEESLAEYEQKLKVLSEIQRENAEQRQQTKYIEVLVKELVHMMYSMFRQMDGMRSDLAMTLIQQRQREV